MRAVKYSSGLSFVNEKCTLETPSPVRLPQGCFQPLTCCSALLQRTWKQQRYDCCSSVTTSPLIQLLQGRSAFLKPPCPDGFFLLQPLGGPPPSFALPSPALSSQVTVATTPNPFRRAIAYLDLRKYDKSVQGLQDNLAIALSWSGQRVPFL